MSSTGARILNRLLQNTFRATVVGWRTGNGGQVRQSLPPSLPPLHHAVYACTPSEVRGFTAVLQYFRLILACMREIPVEQVLAAHILTTYAACGEDQSWLAAAAQEVAGLLKNDHERLLTLLYAIDPQ